MLFITEETSRGEFLINRNMQMIPEFYFSPDVELVPLFFAAVSMKMWFVHFLLSTAICALPYSLCPSITRQRLISVSLKRSTYECVCDMQIKYVWRGAIISSVTLIRENNRSTAISKIQPFHVTKDVDVNSALHACMLEPSRSFVIVPFVHPCSLRVLVP